MKRLPRSFEYRAGDIVGGNEPARAITQPVAAIIGRTVEAQHIEPLFDQRNEGQEMFAVEPVLL